MSGEEYAPAGFVPAAAHLLMIEHNQALCVAIEGLRGELRDLRERLAEHERTQATGGPPPPETRGWANEAIVPAPETAHDQSMAVPDRYQRSDAHLHDRDGAP